MLVALVMLELGKQAHIKAKNVGTAKLALHRSVPLGYAVSVKPGHNFSEYLTLYLHPGCEWRSTEGGLCHQTYRS